MANGTKLLDIYKVIVYTCTYMIVHVHYSCGTYIICTCIRAGVDTDAQGAQENIRLFDNIHEIFTEIL